MSFIGFADHSKLKGLHAFLGASNYHWLNWPEENFEARYISQYATEVGTYIHELANELITNNIKLSLNDRHLIMYKLSKAGIPMVAYDAEEILKNLVPFVNDCIAYHMESEVILYYSPDCFGTTDAINYDEAKKTLRIFDLKTGKTKCSEMQLKVYAALFCLEYKINPKSIEKFELKIYQGGEKLEYYPTSTDIEQIMNMIVLRSALIMKIRERTR